MGVTYRTIEEIRKDFNFSKDVNIIHAKELSEFAPSGSTCITIGQLEAGLKIPLYHPERPLQYEVLSKLSRAPGQMNGNFFRIINAFEDYNKAHPEKKFSSKDIIELHCERRSSARPKCFYLRKKCSADLPSNEVIYRTDIAWYKFPILISGNWTHHPDLPPPPDKYFDPNIWRFDANYVEEETSLDESEKSASTSKPLKSDLKKPNSNLMSSVNYIEKPRSHPPPKTQHSAAEKSSSLHSLKHNTAIVLSSDDEDTACPYVQVLKRQRKVSEAPTQVGLGSFNGIVGDDFSEAINDGDPIQTVDTTHTFADHGNQVDNVSGPWFAELKGESEFQRTGGREDLINIGNFLVQEKFAALYRQIWQRHGHLATRNAIKTSTCILVVAVSELLESITEMATVKSAEIDSPLLDKWEGKIKDAEELKFNVGWLRKHFDVVRKNFDAASSLRNSREIREKALKSALQKQINVRARHDALKVELEKTEQELEQVTLEVFQNEQAVSEDLAAWNRYMTFFEKSILRDAI